MTRTTLHQATIVSQATSSQAFQPAIGVAWGRSDDLSSVAAKRRWTRCKAGERRGDSGG